MKIIAAFDGLKFSETTMKYAIHTAKLINASLIGVFLDDITNTSYKIYDLATSEGVLAEKIKEHEAKDNATRDAAVQKFETTCKEAGITYFIHRDKNVAIQELIHESIYADLLIIDRKETLTHYEENVPTRFIRDLLTDVQCPVLIAPQDFSPVDKVIVLYDGEPSSVHAIKMYSYLFSKTEHKSVEILSVRNDEDLPYIPDNKLMKEFIELHFPIASYKTLQGLPEHEIAGYLSSQSDNTLVILGAYRRSRVSRWFRPSMADTLMKDLKTPLFVAHNK